MTMSVQRANGDFDWGMHHLRAFAIVCILIEHLWWNIGLFQPAQAFFVGSTFYFLFISGYLCQYLELRRPTETKTYYRKKWTNVICPYLVWSITTIAVVRFADVHRAGVLSPELVRWDNLSRLLLFGWAQAPYWYVPFVSVLFLVSPWLWQRKTSELAWLFLVSFSFAVCLPFRPSSHFDGNPAMAFFQYVYFVWSYLLGFLYARLKPRIDPFLESYAVPALGFGILLGLGLLAPEAFTIVCASEIDPNDALRETVLGGPLARSFQKLFFLVPAIVLANRFSGKRIAVLDWLATCSFSMYFSHHFFVSDFVRLQDRLFSLVQPNAFGKALLQMVVTILFVAFNLVLAMVLKKSFGRYSRRFIGA